MKKSIFILMLGGLLFASCNAGQTEQSDSMVDTTVDTTLVDICE